MQGAYENQRGVEIFDVPLDVVGIVRRRLPLVHCIEIGTDVIVPGELCECSERFLDTPPARRSMTEQHGTSNAPIWIDMQRRGLLFVLFTFPVHVLSCEL